MADWGGLAQRCSWISKPPPHVPPPQLSSTAMLLHNGSGIVDWLRGVSCIAKLWANARSDHTAPLQPFITGLHAERRVS